MSWGESETCSLMLPNRKMYASLDGNIDLEGQMVQSEAPNKLKRWRGAAIFLACLILGVFSEIWLALSLLHSWGSDFQIYYQAVYQAQSGASAYFPYALGKSFVYYPFALTLLIEQSE